MRNIAVVGGGYSSEFDVSIRSCQFVVDEIDSDLYNRYLVIITEDRWFVSDGEKEIGEVDRSDFSLNIDGENIKIDYAYIMIHGTPGEDGTLQGYFETIGIKYSSSNLHASSLTFNKYFCNSFLSNYDLNIADSDMIRKGDPYEIDEIAELGFPMFIKPNAGGSSCGITKVKKRSQIEKAIKDAFKESDEVICEKAIKGREFTCGMVNLNEKDIVFPITEIVSKQEFFDFDAKYTSSLVNEITPADIPASVKEEMEDTTAMIYDLLGCRGLVRADYILDGNKLYFLEINTVPGMTEQSLIPQQIRAAGLSVKEILTKIIEQSF